jgi:hypothetical protein
MFLSKRVKPGKGSRNSSRKQKQASESEDESGEDSHEESEEESEEDEEEAPVPKRRKTRGKPRGRPKRSGETRGTGQSKGKPVKGRESGTKRGRSKESPPSEEEEEEEEEEVEPKELDEIRNWLLCDRCRLLSSSQKKAMRSSYPARLRKAGGPCTLTYLRRISSGRRELEFTSLLVFVEAMSDEAAGRHIWSQPSQAVLQVRIDEVDHEVHVRILSALAPDAIMTTEEAAEYFYYFPDLAKLQGVSTTLKKSADRSKTARGQVSTGSTLYIKGYIGEAAALVWLLTKTRGRNKVDWVERGSQVVAALMVAKQHVLANWTAPFWSKKEIQSFFASIEVVRPQQLKVMQDVLVPPEKKRREGTLLSPEAAYSELKVSLGGDADSDSETEVPDSDPVAKGLVKVFQRRPQRLHQLVRMTQQANNRDQGCLMRKLILETYPALPSQLVAASAAIKLSLPISYEQWERLREWYSSLKPLGLSLPAGMTEIRPMFEDFVSTRPVFDTLTRRRHNTQVVCTAALPPSRCLLLSVRCLAINTSPRIPRCRRLISVHTSHTCAPHYWAFVA